MLEVKLRVLPEQMGELLLATGADGVAITVTDTVPAALAGHPDTAAVTEYVPAAAEETLLSVGFCPDEEKLLGPLQL